MSLQYAELLIVVDVLAVDRVQITLTHRQVIDGIQDVGLAHSVGPHQAVEPGRKIYLQFLIILVMCQIKGSEMHTNVLIQNPKGCG
jgi:hypothetical protein